MPVLLWAGVFIISLLALVLAAMFFTRCAERLGLYLGLPSFIVGVTIVAVGTSLPELLSSVMAVTAGRSEVVIGNVLGSNVTNVFLVLGLSAIVAGRLETVYDLVHVDLPFLGGSAALLAITVWDGRFTLPEALLCLAALVVYLHYAVSTQRELEACAQGEANAARASGSVAGSVVILLASVLFMYLGARYTVESLVTLSALLNIGTQIIAASVVAVGTSLPELVVSVMAARRGEQGLVIGNVLGSNIFNALGVMALPRFFGDLALPPDMLTFALPMMGLATLMYMLKTQDRQITRWEGWLLLLFFVLFVGKLYSRF